MYSYFYSRVCIPKYKRRNQSSLRKALIAEYMFYLPFTVMFSSLPPAKAQCLSDKGKDVRVLQDGLGSRFPCTVPTTGVHPDHQRLTLHRAAANPILQGSTELQRVQRYHTVVMICCQKQDSGVGRARVRWVRQIMEGRIPGERMTKTKRKENVRGVS